nr:hypothetical transcript [Hymenolepis microstoma]
MGNGPIFNGCSLFERKSQNRAVFFIFSQGLASHVFCIKFISRIRLKSSEMGDSVSLANIHQEYSSLMAVIDKKMRTFEAFIDYLGEDENTLSDFQYNAMLNDVLGLLERGQTLRVAKDKIRILGAVEDTVHTSLNETSSIYAAKFPSIKLQQKLDLATSTIMRKQNV